MIIEVEEATEKVKQAQLALIEAVGKAYPVGTEVVARLGTHRVHLRVTGPRTTYWSGAGQMFGVNVKTGTQREFYDSDVVEVIK